MVFPSKKAMKTRMTTISGSASKAPHRLTADDISAIILVATYRCLTGRLIASLLQRDLITTRLPTRLRLLAEHEYLDRREPLSLRSEGRPAYAYMLAERGAEIAAHQQGLQRSEIDWKPSDNNVNPLFLSHLMAINQVMVYVTLAARQHGYSILSWRDDRMLRRAHASDAMSVTLPNGTSRKTTVIPDSYVALRTERGTGHFFFEIDLATITAEATSSQKRDWRLKTLAYQQYRHSGLFAQRYDGATGFRVLTVTTTEDRLATLRSATERANGRSQYWFSTFARIEGNDILVDRLWDVANRHGERSSLVS